MQCKRMHRPGQLGTQGAIDLLMASNLTLPCKLLAYQYHAKMCFGISGDAVHMAFVRHFKVASRKGLCQLLFNFGLDLHTCNYLVRSRRCDGRQL